MMFIFHLVIALLFGIVVVYSMYKTRGYKAAIPLGGIVLLFVIHCIIHQASCITCRLDDATCIIELVVFWILVLWGLIASRR